MEFFESCNVNIFFELLVVFNLGKFFYVWRKFIDERIRFFFSLMEDMVVNNIVKREIVWERVISDFRLVVFGFIFGKDDDEEVVKVK